MKIPILGGVWAGYFCSAIVVCRTTVVANPSKPVRLALGIVPLIDALTSSAWRAFRIGILLATTITLVGCGGVRRRLTVRTNPPGAMVYIDKQKIGVSPISTAYTYYGTREIEVTADGYNTQRVLRNMRPTWYQLPGVDFFAENLWPFELRDQRVIDITMVPATQKTPEELLANGEAFRIQSSQAVATGPPAAVVPGGFVDPSFPQFEPLPPTAVPPPFSQQAPGSPQNFQAPNSLDPSQFFAPSGLPPTRLPEVGGIGGGYRPPVTAPNDYPN